MSAPWEVVPFDDQRDSLVRQRPLWPLDLSSITDLLEYLANSDRIALYRSTFKVDFFNPRHQYSFDTEAFTTSDRNARFSALVFGRVKTAPVCTISLPVNIGRLNHTSVYAMVISSAR